LTNGTRTSYTYDAASRVQQLYNLKADGSVILGLTYDHDPVGNPTGMLESSGDRVTWSYDPADRLTREQRSGPSAYDTTYTYDPLGNRLVKDASGALTTSTYDLANQLVTSEDANGVTTYTYDLAGNLHIVEHAHRRSGRRPPGTTRIARPACCSPTAARSPIPPASTASATANKSRKPRQNSSGTSTSTWLKRMPPTKSRPFTPTSHNRTASVQDA
jgi:YD repeat-containing protein